jgi:hypothetical protein
MYYASLNKSGAYLFFLLQVPVIDKSHRQQ